MLFKIALRSILRNRRRSFVTALAITVGAVALLMFGAFRTYVYRAMETNAVQNVGHLTVFHEGFFLYGAGNPAAWSIAEHERVMRLIAEDPVLKPMLRVVTPALQLQGIAGHDGADGQTAKTFVAIGVVPSDRDRMHHWDDYHLGADRWQAVQLRDDAPERAVLGLGIARILGVCGGEGLPECAPHPAEPGRDEGSSLPPDLGALAAEAAPAPEGGARQVDLLAATAAGAPNIVTIQVVGTSAQMAKDFDDVYVGLHLQLAQQLLYGRGTPQVTSIALLLDHTADMPAARARLAQIFHDQKLPLEVRDFIELTPFYGQVRNFFDALFLFIASIMGVIVLFTVINTMTMAVVERTTEIGTIRALGLRRGAVRRQFLLEGALLGAFGASIGLAAADGLISLVNHSGAMWQPPGNSIPVPFQLADSGIGGLFAFAWIVLVLIATLAALFPANRAARLQVVDALRHV